MNELGSLIKCKNHTMRLRDRDAFALTTRNFTKTKALATVLPNPDCAS
jgi:hypothetical protein